MSYIRFFHGCTEMGDVAVFVGGAPVTRQLAYGESTPHFLIGSGQTVIRVEEDGKVKLQNHVIIPEGQAFTLFLICRSGFPELIPIAEDGQAAPEGMSGLRIASFANTAQPMDLWRQAPEEAELLFSEMVQGDVSEYVQLEKGEYRWELREGTATVCMLPGQQLDDRQLYTVYMIGRGDPDEEERPLVMCMLQDIRGKVENPGSV